MANKWNIVTALSYHFYFSLIPTAELLLRTLGALLLLLYHWLEGIVLSIISDKLLAQEVSSEIALITGGGNGIGKELAIRLAQRGCQVVIWDIDPIGLADTAKWIQESGGICFKYVCDVRDRHEIYKTAKLVKADVGTVTLLINNAGYASKAKFLNKRDEDILKTMEINTLSHFWTCKAFLPAMIESNHGHIVTIASLAGYAGVIGLSDYCASKYAVIGFTESLRMELMENCANGVHLTEISPYFCNTAMFSEIQSKLIPVLDFKTVADKIMWAILAKRTHAYVPYIFQPLLFIKWMLPAKSLFYGFSLLGISDAMKGVLSYNGLKKNTEVDNSDGLRPSNYRFSRKNRNYVEHPSSSL